MNILDKVKAVFSDRQKSYDHPSKNFLRIANILNGQGFRREQDGSVREIKSTDIAELMIGVKLGRWSYQYKEDHPIDIIGYCVADSLIRS